MDVAASAAVEVVEAGSAEIVVAVAAVGLDQDRWWTAYLIGSDLNHDDLKYSEPLPPQILLSLENCLHREEAPLGRENLVRF